MFRNVESLPYCEKRGQRDLWERHREQTFEATMRAPRNTRSQAQSSVTMWRCDFARVM
jgi:hypothetical protein